MSTPTLIQAIVSSGERRYVASGSMAKSRIMPSLALVQAIASIKIGRRREGRAMLEQVLEAEPCNVLAWLWMTEVADSDEERREYLNRVLAINPDNASALRALDVFGSAEVLPPWMMLSRRVGPWAQTLPANRGMF